MITGDKIGMTLSVEVRCALIAKDILLYPKP